MSKSRMLSLCFVICLLLGCEEKPPEKATLVKPGAPMLKIKVMMDGKILVDDQPMDLKELAAKMDELKAANGGIRLYRESEGDVSHGNSLEVVKLALPRAIAISVSSKPDFSDEADFSFKLP